MRGLGTNISALKSLRKKTASAMANMAEPMRLTLVAPTGVNPGELRMLTYLPPGLPPGAPLVVVMHGCTQNAAAYDHGAGWSTLAERHGFALLFPEQQRANNPNLCMNWFQPEDATRGHGEVESVREMIAQMLETHALDPRRVYVTGLSAGGAMTAAMLATAPELFAGAAIIAGLPYAAATNVREAIAAMGHPHRHSPREWGNLVRAQSPNHAGPWPTLQIWHGAADDTVAPANAEALVQQWTDVFALPTRPDQTETVNGAKHDVWRARGQVALESWTIPAMGHGTPIISGGTDADRGVGTAGPYMLAGPISSTWQIARSWGLLTQPARTRAEPPKPAHTATSHDFSGAVGSVIERALRTAGLMK